MFLFVHELAVRTMMFIDIAQATPGLVLPEERTSGLGCIPEGRTVSYQCTVTDTSAASAGDGSTLPIGSTVWRGSAVTCPNRMDEISLRHSAYDTEEGAKGTCGSLSALSVNVSGTFYTSELTLTPTFMMNGSVISCSLSGNFPFGIDHLKVGGKSLIASVYAVTVMVNS